MLLNVYLSLANTVTCSKLAVHPFSLGSNNSRCMRFVFRSVTSSGGLTTASVVLDRGTQVGEIKGLCSPLLPDEFLLPVCLCPLKITETGEKLREVGLNVGSFPQKELGDCSVLSRANGLSLLPFPLASCSVSKTSPARAAEPYNSQAEKGHRPLSCAPAQRARA